jgi:hypothetical protein
MVLSRDIEIPRQKHAVEIQPPPTGDYSGGRRESCRERESPPVRSVRSKESESRSRSRVSDPPPETCVQESAGPKAYKSHPRVTNP